jgi:hypothetical protein
VASKSATLWESSGIPTMISRSDYIKGQVLHRAYYSQFVVDAHYSRINNSIGIDRILESQDEHFNDIPLELWDAVAVPVPAETNKIMKECGDYPTLCGAVCTLKEAARQLKEAAQV